jgi:hypothetical protein
VLHLLRDAVEHGSIAVESLQKQAVSRPFQILEVIPAIAAPARQVHAVHDSAVSGIHGLVRLVNRGVGLAADTTLDLLEARQATPPQDGRAR